MKLLNGTLWSIGFIILVFIWLRQLLLHRHITAKSHAGIIGQFSENVVRTGEISIEEFRVYSKLLNWRTKGDYSDLYDFTQEDVDMVMVPARQFIDKVKELIVLP